MTDFTPLTVEEAIRGRRATRAYTAEVPSRETVERVARLALEAPTAFNLQSADLVVVQDAATKQAIFDASGQKQFLAAPVIFVTVARLDQVPEDVAQILGEERAEAVRGMRAGHTPQKLREAGIKDAMLVAGFLLLAAQDAGLATSPTTGWDEEKIKDAIGLGGREDRAIGLVVAAGYPDEQPAHPGRAASRLVWEGYADER